MSYLPDTKGRLAPSLIIRCYEATYESNGDFTKEYGNIVGAAYSFSRNEQKEFVKRRSLGRRGVQPFQVIPQKIETILNLKRVVLYRDDFLREIGDIDGSLLYQTRPLLFQEAQRNPNGETDLYEYHDCWFATNPMEYDIMSNDILIKQDIEIVCSHMVPLGTGFAGIPKIIQQIKELLTRPFKF